MCLAKLVIIGVQPASQADVATAVGMGSSGPTLRRSTPCHTNLRWVALATTWEIDLTKNTLYDANPADFGLFLHAAQTF